MKFEDLHEATQEQIMLIASMFHIRNRTKHADGSLGEVRITIKQFNEALTQAYEAGTKNAPERNNTPS
jgi:hypothetical protein